MKRVLIAGQDSYIGTKLASWLPKDRFTCDSLDMRGDAWKTFDFSVYSAVVLVAGIAHQRETMENRALYDLVNHRMAALAADKAKREGVSQFVLFSSMSVYGLEVGRITADTRPKPVTAYGKSKLNAEIAVQALADEAFQVAVLRPPMIYGPGCRGNYPRLSNVIRKLPLFPYVNNQRSMLFIDTLCAFVQTLLDSGAGGLFFPQNAVYVSTSALAAAIAKAHGKKLLQPRGFGWLLTLLSKRGGTIGKVFGSLTYDLQMSQTYMPENQIDFQDSIQKTEAVV